MEDIEKILVQAQALSDADQRELLRQLHDAIYKPQYAAAPAARPHIGV